MILVKVAANRKVILEYDVFSLFSLIPEYVSDIIVQHEEVFDSHVPEYKMEEEIQKKVSKSFSSLYANVSYSKGIILVTLTTTVVPKEPIFH